jgi:hypothetical protein
LFVLKVLVLQNGEKIMDRIAHPMDRIITPTKKKDEEEEEEEEGEDGVWSRR